MNPLQSTQVGKFYRVPCVQALVDTLYAKAGRWTAVLLPRHEDSEIIKFEEQHYHLDLRFLSGAFYREFDPLPHGIPVTEFSLNPFTGTTTASSYRVTSGLEYRYKKCLRSMPAWYPHHKAVWLAELEAKYKDAILKNRICPHKGVDLSDCPVVDGMIVCPAHGLTWCAETGVLIQQTGVKNAR